MAVMTNAQFIARELALSILKAYHRRLAGDELPSPADREKAQVAAFEQAEKHVRSIALRAIEQSGEYTVSDLNAWLDEKASES